MIFHLSIRQQWLEIGSPVRGGTDLRLKVINDAQ